MQRFGYVLAALLLSGCATGYGSSSFEVVNQTNARGEVHVGTDRENEYALYYDPREVRRRGSSLFVVAEYHYPNGVDLQQHEMDCAGKKWRITATASSGRYADLRPTNDDYWLQITGNTSTAVRALFDSVCR